MPKGEQISLDDQDVRLSPPLEQFRNQLKASRKKLMGDKAANGTSPFDDPRQLRLFIGTHVFPQLDQMFKMLAGLGLETYALAASNGNELLRLHAFTVDELNRLGAELDEDARVPGVSPDVLDKFQQCFYALGSALQEQAPGNKILEEHFNRCAEAVSEIIGELMGDYDDRDDDDDDDRDDDDDDDRDDGENESAKDDAPVVDAEDPVDPPAKKPGVPLEGGE